MSFFQSYTLGMGTAGAVRWIEGAGGDAIVVDDRHFPVVISTWFGSSGEDTVRGYYRWLHELTERARSANVPLVNITDAGLAGLPSSAVRRLIAELTLEWDREVLRGHPVFAFVVVENAIVRGVLNAIAWMHGAMSAENVASLRTAIERGFQELERVGVAVPASLDPAKATRPARKSTPSREARTTR